MDLLSGRKGALALTLIFTLVLTLLCGCTAVAGPSAAPQTAAPAGEAPVADIDPDAVVVSTVDGLLSAIAPGASIVLEPGVYDLSAASSYGQDDSGSRYFGWTGVDDGYYQLSISGLSGLSISAATPGAATITRAGEYASLFFMESCDNIRIAGVGLGQSVDPQGLGQSVLCFYNCHDLSIEDCSIYNGRLGLQCNNVRSLRVQDTDIYDCEDNAVLLQGCTDILLDGCKISDCGEDESNASLLRFQACSDAAVINCDILDNENALMLNSTDTTGLYLGGLDVRENEFERVFLLAYGSVTVYGCAFTDNEIYAWYEGTDADAGRQLSAALSPEGEELTGVQLAGMTLIRPAVWKSQTSATPPPLELSADENGEIRVSTVDQLLAAIAPNVSIVLEPGTYDLSKATGYGSADSGSGYYGWEQCYDGAELCIMNAENLSLSSADPDDVTISALPRYADVISFYDCDGLRLSNLTLGHTEEPGECSGGVVYMSGCQGAAVDNCRLYGCGIIGLTADRCDLLTVRNTDIFGCSYGGVSIDASRGVLLDNCDIYDCEVLMSGLISFTGCQDCAYINSEINRNSGMGLVYTSYSQDIYLAGLDIHDNTFDRMFYFDPYSPTLESCAFTENIIPGQWYGSEYEPVDSVMAVDKAGKELSQDDLTAMTVSGDVVWTPAPIDEKAAGSAPLPSEDGAIHVSTVDELLAAIAPKTKIYLEAGVYDLSQATGYGSASGSYYSWVQDYDGPELVISDVDELTITGAGVDKVTVSARPRYADVLCFMDCDDISLSGFTVGHTEEPGACSGGVLYFDGCDDVSVIECSLFGCGILGISGFDCEDMTVSKTEIYDCSSGGVYFARCSGVAMVGCNLHDNGGPDYSHYMCTKMTVDGSPMPNV